MSGLDEKGLIEPCGGCGEADPAKRCLNCHHEFFPNRRASAPPAPDGLEPVAWRWKAKDAVIWIYDPADEWLRKQSDDEIDREPLYSATALERVTRERDEARRELAATVRKFNCDNADQFWKNITRIRNRAESAEAKLAEARKVIAGWLSAEDQWDCTKGADDLVKERMSTARRFLEETK